MAGRPKTMAKRVTALEDRALQLTIDLFKIVPLQYLDHPNDGDPFNRAWNEATDATRTAMCKLEDLGALVREKAGITVLGPIASWRDERKKEAAEPVVFDGEGI